MTLRTFTTAVAAWLFLGRAIVFGEILENFTEPYETVEVASGEVGIVSRTTIREGDRVQAGQPIAFLDSAVLIAQLEAARARAAATARIAAAEAEWKIRKNQLELIRKLHADQHSPPRELIRATADADIAQSNLAAVREDQHLAYLETQTISRQLDRRRLRSPIDGVVLAVHKNIGESVAANDPRVATIATLDKLRVKFYLDASRLGDWHQGDRVQLLAVVAGQTLQGTIDLIFPVTDPNTNTVRVDIVIDNRAEQIRSGVRCRWGLEPSSRSEVGRIISTREIR